MNDLISDTTKSSSRIRKKSKQKKPITSGSIVKFTLYLVIFIILSYVLSIILFNSIFHIQISTNIPFYNMLISALIITLVIRFVGSVMLSYLIIYAYRRTKYTGYVYEGFELLGLNILILVILVLIIFFPDWTPLIFLADFLLIFGYPFIRKPLIWNSTYHRTFSDFRTSQKSDIILRQSMYINDYQDGYSTRPIFLDCSDLIEKIGNYKEVERKSVKFAEFLGLNGDLIGYKYDANSKKLSLFPRTSFVKQGDALNLVGLYRKIKHIVNNENITTMTFDFTSKEMNLKLNKSDYEGLDDITYYQFVQRMLQQFKLSLEKFVDGKYLDSYEAVMPENIKTRSFILDDYIIAFCAIGYIIGIFLIGATYVYYANILKPSVNINNIFFLIGWPLITYVGVQYLYGILTGHDPYHYQQYVPIVVLVHLITLFSTFLVYLLLYKSKLKRRKNPIKTLKLPK